MKEHAIRKVIQITGESCPEFKYKNPLLDKNTADLLSKGFINWLPSLNSGEIRSERDLVLKNIRELCKVGPSQHLNIDDDVSDVLQKAYEMCPANTNINKDLDAYLIRNLMEINIASLYASSYKPDVIQALLNLNEDKEKIYDMLSKDVIHWNVDSENSQYLGILKTMWDVDSLQDHIKIENKRKIYFSDISIKIKPLIEEILLPSIFEMLDCCIIDDDDEWFSSQKDIERLVTICSITSECFQICCSIMNTIFINTKFHKHMIQFIKLFINAIRCKKIHISHLYPYNLQHTVLLLDIDINDLEGEVKEKYIKHTLDRLNLLHRECESDLIMLLSHFSLWFDIYYESKET